MSNKIAIAVIHGIGKTNEEFADSASENFVGGISPRVCKAVAKALSVPVDQVTERLVFKAVYWADIVQDRQNDLFGRLNIERKTNPAFKLRDFVFHSLADSIAYQPLVSQDGLNIYNKIHQCFADTLKSLAHEAGDSAPLFVIAHSMGSAIATNFIWDAQHGNPDIVTKPTALERCETLTSLYTFGSQIPFWSLRHEEFGKPVQVPSPQLATHYPAGIKGEWLNFYDRDDVLGYPIQHINPLYEQAVTDVEVKIFDLLKGWNLFSHNEYWKNKQVVQSISDSLAQTLQTTQQRSTQSSLVHT